MEQALSVTPPADIRRLAELLKALGDATRLAILTMLLEGERCVCEIEEALPLSQPAVSHHLKILRQAGLVTDRREGKWSYYDLDRQGLEGVQSLLAAVLLQPLQQRQAGAGRRPPPRCRLDNGGRNS